MKKRLFSILVCFSLILCSLMFVGCGNNKYTKDDVANLYTSMQTNEKTQQFFKGNFLTVDFDEDKIDLSSTDKSYIFPSVYHYYLKSSSDLMFGVVDRLGKISYVVKDFSAEQIVDIYNKLSNVNNCMINLADSKEIYETSNGNLHYKNVLARYNNLIKSLYTLNDAFAKYYFVPNIAKTDFSKEELSDGNVRDMLRYQMILLSKVSFNYDLLNFVSTNPLGEINSWYNSTYYLKEYITLCSEVLITLQNTNNLGLSAAPYTQNVKNLFANAQEQEEEYKNEYDLFSKALNSFDLKAYFAAANKSAYIESRSNTEKSCYQVMKNFLDGRYNAFVSCLSLANNYI